MLRCVELGLNTCIRIIIGKYGIYNKMQWVYSHKTSKHMDQLAISMAI